MKKQYSVLMSVYEKEKPEFLISCLESMVGQSVLTDDFVIVADGILTKELYDVLEKFKRQYSFIHIEQLEQNSGAGVALNYGIKCCKNNLIAHIDSDDISEKNRCELQLKEFEIDEELDILGSYMYVFSQNDESPDYIKKVPLSHNEIYKYAKRRNPFNHSSVMYKKDRIKELGNYPSERRGQDLLFFTNLILGGANCKNMDYPLVRYRANSDMYKRKKTWTTTKNIIRIRVMYWRKGYSSLIDVFYVLITRLLGYICPSIIGEIIYKSQYKKSNKKCECKIS